MKAIDFSDNELELLHHLFKSEFDDATDYVDNIRSVLRRISAANTIPDAEPVVKEKRPPLRQPRAEKSAIIPVTDIAIKKPRTRNDKGRKRNTPGPNVNLQVGMSEMERDFLLKKAASMLKGPHKPVRSGLKRRKKQKGVFLVPMGR